MSPELPDIIGAFSMEIRNDAGEVVAKGERIRRLAGGASPGPLEVAPGQTSSQRIVLNRWCSTLLLAPGRYELTVQVEYRLGSESQPVGQRGGLTEYKAGSLHTKDFKLDLSISPMDARKFKDGLERVKIRAFPSGYSEKEPTCEETQTMRELLALTESDMAVPYQLEVLAAAGPIEIKRDAINSLARSKTLDAAVGLMKLVEKQGFENIRPYLADAVYRTRETGQPEIIAATDEFIRKHKRPARLW